MGSPKVNACLQMLTTVCLLVGEETIVTLVIWVPSKDHNMTCFIKKETSQETGNQQVKWQVEESLQTTTSHNDVCKNSSIRKTYNVLTAL